jgi:hypothetical protein
MGRKPNGVALFEGKDNPISDPQNPSDTLAAKRISAGKIAVYEFLFHD